MATSWFYAIDGEKKGPVSSEELAKLAKNGQLKKGDLVWREGMESWANAGRVKGLFLESATPPDLPPPLPKILDDNLSEASTLGNEISGDVIGRNPKTKGNSGNNYNDAPNNELLKSATEKAKPGFKIPNWVKGLVLVGAAIAAIINHSSKSTSTGSSSTTKSNDEKVDAANSDGYNWNKSESDAFESGNVETAGKIIRANNFQKEGPVKSITEVLKTPWNYYGKTYCFKGTVSASQDEAPEGDVAKALGSKIASQTTVMEDESNALVVLSPVTSSGIREGDTVMVCGLPVGRAELKSGIGGTTTGLVVVGYRTKFSEQSSKKSTTDDDDFEYAKKFNSVNRPAPQEASKSGNLKSNSISQQELIAKINEATSKKISENYKYADTSGKNCIVFMKYIYVLDKSGRIIGSSFKSPIYPNFFQSMLSASQDQYIVDYLKETEDVFDRIGSFDIDIPSSYLKNGKIALTATLRAGLSLPSVSESSSSFDSDKKDHRCEELQKRITDNVERFYGGLLRQS